MAALANDDERLPLIDIQNGIRIIDGRENTHDIPFSFRRLLSFVGPGFLISIAYLDPGNIEADLQSGTAVGFKLLWVLLISTIIGLLTQRIAARIGVVTGYHMSKLCYKIYPRFPRICLWLLMEVAVIGADIQEVIGASIAISFLSRQKIPLYGGVLLTILDTFTFLLLEDHGLKRVGYGFGVGIATMFAAFFYEYVTADVNFASVLKGIFIPYCTGCGAYSAWTQGVGIFGACIMPHNLFLHSHLVNSRERHSRDSAKIREANKYNLIETGISLFVSFIINLFIVSVFAQGLFNQTNASVLKLCEERNMSDANQFPNNNKTVTDMNIFRGGVYLGCAFGERALIIWAAGIVISGQGSTITGTYSGQIIMEGFLDLEWKRWARILITRSIAILPTILLSLFTGINEMMVLNDIMNVLMTILLPFALIPAITLSNSRYIMREFRNGRLSKAVLSIVSFGVIFLNFFAVGNLFWEWLKFQWKMWAIVAFLCCFYSAFIFYLLLFQFALDGYDNCLTRLVLNQNHGFWNEVHSDSVLLPPKEEHRQEHGKWRRVFPNCCCLK